MPFPAAEPRPAPLNRPDRPDHTRHQRQSPAEAQTTCNTPLGPLLLVATARGLAGAWFDAQRHHPGRFDLPDNPDHPWLRAATLAFDAYFHAGAQAHAATAAFDLPFDTGGTPFQAAVWRALCAVPAGITTSYSAVAAALGRPAAVRAVGMAVGRNPVSIAIPCHRVLGRDGSLTGYAGGLWRKQALLQHEGLPLGPAPADLARQRLAPGFHAPGVSQQVTALQTDLFTPTDARTGHGTHR